MVRTSVSTVFTLCPVECRDWHRILDSHNCPYQALIGNNWASEEELLGLTKEDHLWKLQEKISLKLNKSVHTIEDTMLRSVYEGNGSLCGIAAFYQALQLTLLTRQLTITPFTPFQVSTKPDNL